MKKIIIFMLTIITMTGCQTQTSKYAESFLSFDTYIEFSAYTKDETEFKKYFHIAQQQFENYNKLFDAYNSYDNINNIKTINDYAGRKPIVVDKEVFNLIKDSIALYKETKQKNNIALAPVILIYKDVLAQYNSKKTVKNPEMTLLKEKAKCTNIDNIVLDEAKQSVYLKQSCARIDVGSVAKGYATNKVALNLQKKELKSGIINAGGNVVVIGKKPQNEKFKIGIADPEDPENYKLIIKAVNFNIVTSGDYQRYYMIDGVRMNHIIDPQTLKPAMVNKSVTIVTKDGLEADYFSTESFMLPLKAIKELAQKFNFEYVVIDKKNKITVSKGLKNVVEIK